MEFNEYLKSCRLHNNFTQEELVDTLYSYDIENFSGLDTSTFSKWERGVTKPKTTKKISIIKYFQEKSNIALPCWESYTTQETENFICQSGLQNLLGKSKNLVLKFPSKMMHVDELKIYPLRNFERMDALLKMNMDLHQSSNHASTQVSIEQFKKWSLHPSNLFLACEYKESFIGLFFILSLKTEVFDKLMNFKMKKSDITVKDFTVLHEEGCHLMLSFYALNSKVATALIIRYYAHLIANQSSVNEVGVITQLAEVKKIVQSMNLDYHDGKTFDNTEIQTLKQSLFNILASEQVVKMLFSKQSCPEE